MFVLDTSRLMGEAVPFVGAIVGSKLDFAKSSMKHMVGEFDWSVQSGNGDLAVGVTHYSSYQEPYYYMPGGMLNLLGNGGSIIQPPASLDTTSDGVLSTEMAMRGKMGPLDFNRFFRESTSTLGELPVPAEKNSHGSLGWALYGAQQGIGGTSGERRIAIVLSTGVPYELANSGGPYVPSGDVMATDMLAEGIELYFVNIDVGLGRSLTQSPGLLQPNSWTVRYAEDLPGVLSEMGADLP
jgi:hypothetical protein